MNSSPHHDELAEMLPAAALEILDQADLQRVLSHARDCQECTRALDEYRDATGALGLLLPPRQMEPARSALVRARLVGRARGEARRGRTALIASRWTGWGVAAALAGVLLVHHAVHRPLAYGWLAAGVLMGALVALGVYAATQRRRLAVLQERVTALERGATSQDRSSPGIRGLP